MEVFDVVLLLVFVVFRGRTSNWLDQMDSASLDCRWNGPQQTGRQVKSDEAVGRDKPGATDILAKPDR